MTPAGHRAPATDRPHVLLDRRTRILRRGGVVRVLGGDPVTLITPAPSVAGLLDGGRTVATDTPAGAALARALTDRGMAHPAGPVSADRSLDGVAVVVPVRDDADGVAALARALAPELARVAHLVVVADGPATPGRTVTLRPRTGPAAWLRLTAPCEVTEVTDRPDAHGFTYRALPGHPERGWERFLVRRDPATDAVSLTITAESAHATLLARLGAPVARAEQDRLTRRYLAALRPDDHRS